ncbi:PHP domain-containing protein [Chloroflexota bacterium]
MDKLLKADFHIHTEYSMDCSTPLEEIINRCLKVGINCIAIADHGTIEGAVRMKSIAPFTVIVAQEILTPHGEIMGMFLKEGIPGGLSVEQAISRIKAQGGLVCIPHPFDNLTRRGLGEQKLKALVKQIDIIEVFNARSPLAQYSNKALAFASKYGIPGTAGSDAHTLGEIGNTYVEIPGFNSHDELLDTLDKGRIFGHRTNPLVHFAGVWTRLKRLL